MSWVLRLFRDLCKRSCSQSELHVISFSLNSETFGTARGFNWITPVSYATKKVLLKYLRSLFRWDCSFHSIVVQTIEYRHWWHRSTQRWVRQEHSSEIRMEICSSPPNEFCILLIFSELSGQGCVWSKKIHEIYNGNTYVEVKWMFGWTECDKVRGEKNCKSRLTW